MTFGAILLLALGLAMDATAVAAARGMVASRIRLKHVLLVAGFFGGFQALMPLLGAFLGARLNAWIGGWDYVLAGVLLCGVGGKMLWEARHARDETKQSVGDPFAIKVLLLLAVATSIDAWAVGVTLPILKAPLGLSVLVIGVTTAILSALGLLLGRRFGALLGRRLDIAGGLVLVGMGAKIVLEHAH